MPSKPWKTLIHATDAVIYNDFETARENITQDMKINNRGQKSNSESSVQIPQGTLYICPCNMIEKKAPKNTEFLLNYVLD